MARRWNAVRHRPATTDMRRVLRREPLPALRNSRIAVLFDPADPNRNRLEFEGDSGAREL